MANQIFNFPGFFDREIDLTEQKQEPVGTPAGVVGASERGPAFVPITVGSFADFKTRFGDLNPRFAAPYAAEKFLRNRTALTFLRVLGAGSNETTSDIDTTRTQGTVKNAGFIVSASATPSAPTKTVNNVQFITARHVVSASEAFAFPTFTNNDTYFTTGSSDEVYLTRAVLFTANDARVFIADHDEALSTSVLDDVATANSSSGEFKLVISSSVGSSFANDDGLAGQKILTASLNPSKNTYIGKLLNTDPEKFEEEKHLLYLDFAVDNELASVGTGSNDIAIASGSSNTSSTSGDSSLSFLEMFGRYDTRYQTPRSPWIISQPYGETEHNLFYFEAIDDGDYANDKFKVSIANVQKSSNPRDEHGSFTVLVRAFDDTDTNPKILEQFNGVNLDPDSDNFIGKVIGDKKAVFNFDVVNEEDRRLIISGKYPNKSRNIRVVINQDVLDKKIPENAVPFGYKGPEILNTNSVLLDATGSSGFSGIQRLNAEGATDPRLEAAIVPPIPYRFKVTRGDVKTSGGGLIGEPGTSEITDGRYYWGVKFTRNSNPTNPNIVSQENKFIKSITKFAGIDKLDALVTGSHTDKFNNNKFTLARVALGNSSISDITSSVDVHMKEAAYIRNGKPDSFDYKIDDGGTGRVTLASLYQKGSTAADFNKFRTFTKFTTVMFGGFNGTNILDKNAATLNDRASSTETRTSDGTTGNAAATFNSPGFDINQNGVGVENSVVNSYRIASDIITDSLASNINLLAVPGQRDPLVADYTADNASDFGLALYVMDVPFYDSNSDRVWDGETGHFLSVEQTANTFEQRALDNEFAAAYFPNVVIDDNVNRRKVTVPSSIAALSALGFNDKVAFPWFAPAGFNRAALDFVDLTQVKIKQSERERLFATNINPIIKFPREGFVIFSQNTLLQPESALNSINVVRMLNEVKRQIIQIGNKVVWEQIDQSLRTQIADSFRKVLNTVTARQGIERFEVVVDERNNTAEDVNNNRINVRIVLVPTRAIEFIAIDFIITRSGVEFVT